MSVPGTSFAAAGEPQWIWSPAPDPGVRTVYFRKAFRAPLYTWNSRLTLTADDEAEVFLNGKLVASCKSWDAPINAEVTVRLNQADNVLAVRAVSASGTAGLIAHLNMGGEEGLTVVSDGTWLTQTKEEPGWNTLKFNAADWAPAKVIGPHGIQPWGEVLWRPAATPAEALVVTPGFKAELIRSSLPGEGSWICMTVDAQGRLIIGSQDQKQLLRFTMDSHGRIAKKEPIETGLTQPMGMLYAFDSLYVNGRGPEGTGLYRLRDGNGDDQFSPDEARLLKQFAGSGEHGYHALALGPDNMIYVMNGNGTRLPEGLSKRSPMKNFTIDCLSLDLEERSSGGGSRLPEGHVLRTDRDGREWELFCGGFRNAYDFDFNADGELFTFDSDAEWDWGTPWYRATRINHCVSGGDYGWRAGPRLRPDEFEDSLPGVAYIGVGSPTGVKFGTAARFPEAYRRALFAMDWSYGRIVAVHLEPKGASYSGTFETFLSGRPLNVTDLEFGNDGAMYFITGGRGTQSGLYRVIWTGERSDTDPDPLPPGPGSNARDRELRREIEGYHGKQDASAVEFIWKHLGSEDRLIRYSARVALENQPVDLWRDRALGESDSATALTALLALTRLSPPGQTQAPVFRALGKFPIDDLSPTERLIKYRVLQIAFLRQGEFDEEWADVAREKLGRQYPAETSSENRMLAPLLGWLEHPEFTGQTVRLIETAPTLEEQLFFVSQLRYMDNGWTLDDRRRYLDWWRTPRDATRHPPELLEWFADVGRDYVDGAFMNRHLQTLHEQAVALLNEEEREALRDVLAQPVVHAPLVPTSERAFVRDWKMADVLPHLERVSRSRDLARGRQAFVDAQCLACHRFGNDGGALGPELNGSGSKYDRRTLLESILEPSRVLNEAYGFTTVRYGESDEVTGRLNADTEDFVEIETDWRSGTTLRIKKHEVRSMGPAAMSPMPEGLVNILDLEEILDLIAYLESGGRPAGPIDAPTH